MFFIVVKHQSLHPDLSMMDEDPAVSGVTERNRERNTEKIKGTESVQQQSIVAA